MTPKNKLTVCTVTLNSAKTVEATIKSVLDQSSSNVTHLIKDGFSSDNTEQIANRYRHVKFIKQKDNGIYNAMNQALDRVTTEFVHFLNSDDVYADSCTIETIIDYMEKEDLDVLFCGIEMVDSHNVVKRRWTMSRFRWLQRLGIEQAPHPGLFLRTSVFKRLEFKFNENFKISSDYELQYLIANDHFLRQARSDIIAVKMLIGGTSTNDWRATYKGLKECVEILKFNNAYCPRTKIVLKALSKLQQMFFRKVK